jgi:hypothetical protein
MTDRGYMRDQEMEAEIDRLRASNAALVEAAVAFDISLSDLCDGPERDKLRAAIAKAKKEAAS